MKKCNKCGVAVQDKATFCHFCGNDLRTKSAENANETKIIDDTVDLNMAEKAQATNGEEPTAGQTKNTNREEPTVGQGMGNNQGNFQMWNDGRPQQPPFPFPPYQGMPYPPQYPFPPYPPMNMMNNQPNTGDLEKHSRRDDYYIEEAEARNNRILKAILAIVLALVAIFTINSLYNGDILEVELSKESYYGRYDEENTKTYGFDYQTISEEYDVKTIFPAFVMLSLLFAFGASVMQRHKVFYAVSAALVLVAIILFVQIHSGMEDHFNDSERYESYIKTWSFRNSGLTVFSGLITQLGMTIFALFGIKQ